MTTSFDSISENKNHIGRTTGRRVRSPATATLWRYKLGSYNVFWVLELYDLWIALSTSPCEDFDPYRNKRRINSANRILAICWLTRRQTACLCPFFLFSGSHEWWVHGRQWASMQMSREAEVHLTPRHASAVNSEASQSSRRGQLHGQGSPHTINFPHQ